MWQTDRHVATAKTALCYASRRGVKKITLHSVPGLDMSASRGGGTFFMNLWSNVIRMSFLTPSVTQTAGTLMIVHPFNHWDAYESTNYQLLTAAANTTTITWYCCRLFLLFCLRRTSGGLFYRQDAIPVIQPVWKHWSEGVNYDTNTNQ